jgi:DinB superfamily
MQFRLSEATQILQRTPATLATVVAGIPEPWLKANEGSGTFSCYDIVGHLIHGELTDWIPRVKIILEHGESRAFEPFDRFAQFREDQSRPIRALLDQFAFMRAENVKILQGLNLTCEDMARRGTHPELGPVTLGQLLSSWVVHDLSHLSQIARVTAKQYSLEVGPWRQYMSILKG